MFMVFTLLWLLSLDLCNLRNFDQKKIGYIVNWERSEVVDESVRLDQAQRYIDLPPVIVIQNSSVIQILCQEISRY